MIKRRKERRMEKKKKKSPRWPKKISSDRSFKTTVWLYFGIRVGYKVSLTGMME
jgi:hypothetical protein